MVDIDTTTEFGERVTRHLEDDRIVWLSTLGANSTPQPSPVWFLWDGDTVLIFSQPDTPKLRNIQANPRVSLNFNCNASGGDVVILTGDAWIDLDTPAANTLPDYVEKYTDGLQGISMTAEQFSEAYSVPVRVRPTSLRGH
jgi:PPOX class probable F420-dependent enzyme